MSEEERNAIADLHEAAERWKTVVKTVWFLIGGAFLLGGWVATIQLQQLTNKNNIAENEISHKSNYTLIGKNKESSLANTRSIISVEERMWSKDNHAAFHSEKRKEEADRFRILTEQNLDQEIRLQRIADNQDRIFDAISDIKESLKSKPAH